MAAVRAVLFDLDDTLFDHQHCSRLGLHELPRTHPAFATHSFEDLEREYLRLIDELHPSVLQGRRSLEEARIERFRQLSVWCGGRDSGSEIELAASFRKTYQRARRPVPGATSLLNHLRDRVAVGIVTNNVTDEQRDKLVACDLDRSIDFMVTSEQVGLAKPDPAIFREALRQADCRAEEAVMVGDSWTSDVLGALGTSIRAVWLNRTGQACPQQGLAAEIASFDSVDDVVRLLLGETPVPAS